MDFEQAIAALGRYQRRGWRLGLDRMQEFMRRLDLADYAWGDTRPLYIHVAGTNGKGSTTAFAESLLRAHGYRTGATYSPYVYNVRERAQANGECISENDFARLVARLITVGDPMEDTELGGPTEFELKTALAFAYWKDQGCNAAAVEVGLGGRLDATNVLDPAASVIVSIGFDHTEYLGDTLGAIATEKAGIIKPGRPSVVGAVGDEAMGAISAIAEQRASPLWRFGHEIRFADGEVVTPAGAWPIPELPLVGIHQPHNAALAVASLAAAGISLNTDLVQQGLLSTRLPGRFERWEVGGANWILDGAHNAQAAESLAATVQRQQMAPVTLVTAMMERHDPERFIDALAPVVERVYTVPLTFPGGSEPSDLAERWQRAGRRATAVTITDLPLLEGNVLAAGSFYLLGELNDFWALRPH